MDDLVAVNGRVCYPRPGGGQAERARGDGGENACDWDQGEDEGEEDGGDEAHELGGVNQIRERKFAR